MIMYYQQLMDKIQNRTAVLGVLGLGYVGLPLAVEKAKVGFSVVGFDVQEEKVKLVNEGHNYIGDVVDSDLKNLTEEGKLTATTDFARLAACDCVAICVPTPLDEHFQPDISYVSSSASQIARYAHQGMLIVLESTTYPGTTEEVIMPLLTEKGFTVGEDIFLAFSPERVDPGNAVYKTKNTPKVVGGVTPHCGELAAAIYRSVLESDVKVVSSPKVAEMEKILENTFRNINIALANEMAILCDRMGISVWEVIDAAKTKPYGFMAFYPGPGLGGHCIPIDPFYLTWKAREYNYHTRLIESAGEINNAMPEYCVGRIADLLNREAKPLRGSKVLMLGITYKPDIDDMRESPALELARLLTEKGCDLSYNDPYVPKFTHKGLTMESVELTAQALQQADVVVIATNHSAYDAKEIVAQSKLVFDSRNLTAGIDAPHLERL